MPSTKTLKGKVKKQKIIEIEEAPFSKIKPLEETISIKNVNKRIEEIKQRLINNKFTLSYIYSLKSDFLYLLDIYNKLSKKTNVDIDMEEVKRLKILIIDNFLRYVNPYLNIQVDSIQLNHIDKLNKINKEVKDEAIKSLFSIINEFSLKEEYAFDILDKLYSAFQTSKNRKSKEVVLENTIFYIINSPRDSKKREKAEELLINSVLAINNIKEKIENLSILIKLYNKKSNPKFKNYLKELFEKFLSTKELEKIIKKQIKKDLPTLYKKHKVKGFVSKAIEWTIDILTSYLPKVIGDIISNIIKKLLKNSLTKIISKGFEKIIKAIKK